jgi:hypothetical protein
MTRTRRIGPVGTSLRVLVGLGLLYVAGGADGLPWDVDWYDPLVGFLALPAIALAIGLAARQYASGPVRFDGPLGIAGNCAAIVAFVANPYTSAGAALFYGATLIVAAWRGQPGCEATVLPNLILHRDDQIGCPTFSPIDEAEMRLRRRRAPAAAGS